MRRFVFFKKICRIIPAVLVMLAALSCTSIGSNVIRHPYIVETLVDAPGYNLNQVTRINILIGDGIYADLLSPVKRGFDASDDAAPDSAEKPSFFSKEETARRQALRQKKHESLQFAVQFKKYIETFYHNRGLQKPHVTILTKPKNCFGYELTFDIRRLDIHFSDEWVSADKMPEATDDGLTFFYNNIDFSRSVNVSVEAMVERYDEKAHSEELTDDVGYVIAASSYIVRKYKNERQQQSLSRFIPKAETFAKYHIRQISADMLYAGAIDKIFRQTFGQRLQATSKDIVYFRYGRGEQFRHAQACLRHGSLDEAELVWQEIYDEPTNPTFARGVAAYNLGMCKTIVRNYEAAAVYFGISEDLRREGLQDLERF